MQVVVQEHPEGCALACAAMLAGLTYRQARHAAAQLGIHAGDKGLYSTAAPLRRLLRYLGLVPAEPEQPFTGWDGLPNCALLAVKWHIEAGRPFWHWVVFIRDAGGAAVLDPSANLTENRRTDWHALKPRWYIKIDTK